MEAAQAQAAGFRNAFRGSPKQASVGWDALEAALDDDFNTQEALSILHQWRSAGQIDLLLRGLTLFGLESLAEQEAAPAGVVELASRRKEARERGEFDEADRLRQEVEAAGWEVRDKPEGFDLVPL
jgi:cysteinyl-tRNA synthetase